MARYLLTSTLLLAFLAGASAQASAPTATPTAAPTPKAPTATAPTPTATAPTPTATAPTPTATAPTPTATAPTPTATAPTPTATAPTPTATAPTPTKTPTSASSKPVSSPTKTPVCKSGFYLKKSTKQCLACVSTKTGTRLSIGRSGCYNPVSSGYDTACAPATLSGAKIRGTFNTQKAVSCIPTKPYKNIVVILLPRKGTYKLSFLNPGLYIKSSFRLNGSIPAATLRGRVVSETVKFQGTEYLKISFNDKYHTLAAKAGKTIYLRGVVRRPDGLLSYCFQVPFKVCK